MSSGVKKSKKSAAAAQVSTDPTEPTTESVQLSKTLAEMQSFDEHDTAEGCCQLADTAFKQSHFDVAFALVRAGVHKHGMSNDKLCKRYLFNLEMIVKDKAAANKKVEGPPRMLYLRELYASIHQIFKEQVLAVAGPEAMLAGDKCVLMKERGVMVVGLSLQEWRVLLEKNTGSDKMQMISGVEEAVMRGLSQSEGTADSQMDLKASWNSWALKLCEAEGGSPHLRSKCLLQRTVLLLQQQMHHKALESATEVLKLYPDSKHASALLATSQHKAGKKKESAATVSELVVAFQRAEDTNMLSDELGHPLELTVALLVEMHRTKDALKLLACLLSRVHGARQQHLFFGLARLYAKHGLNKDALVSKLPSLCSMPPDRRTWELLKSMAECTPAAVEQQLQKYIDEAGPGHFTHVPQITEVMCKLPFGAHGSAAGKALQLLKQCAAQVTPDRPDDLRIIVDDLRAFMSSNIPASVSEMFPRTIETLLNDYVKALGPQHAVESWEMPAELMKRSFNGSPPAALSEQIQCACLRVPVEKEQFLWSVFRNLPPDSGVQLVRAWLLQHDLEEISRMERAVTHVHTAKGEHAAALDIMRWAEVKELSVQRIDVERWKSLYFRVLRNTAEERATSMKRSGSFGVAALDMSTPMLEAADFSMQLAEYRYYRTQLTGLDVPLRNITQSEALILRQFLGERSHAIQGLAQGDELDPARQHARLQAARRHMDVDTAWASHHAASLSMGTDAYGFQVLPEEGLPPSAASIEASELRPLMESTRQASATNAEVGNLVSELRATGRLPGMRMDAGDADAGALATDDGFSHPAVVAPDRPWLAQPDSRATLQERAAERQALLTANALGGEQLTLTTDAARDESLCTRSQLDLALRTLEELQLQAQVPVTLQDDEWQNFVSTLFLSEGWRHLCSRYGQQHDSQHKKQLIVGDLQRLQARMNARGRAALDGGLADGVGDPAHSLQWLSELLTERVQTLSDADLQSTPAKQLADHLAFEIGQSTLWMHSFALVLLPRESESYFAAPAAAQAPFKLAFMLAADRLVPQRGNTAANASEGGAGDRLALSDSPQEKWQSDACRKLLHADPRAALAMAQQILEEVSGTEEEDRLSWLHLVCGDAYFGLEQYAQAVSHFQRYSGGLTSHLPLDAFLEYVCAMLHEGYPAAQVLQVTEEGCPFNLNTQDWLLFVKVLAEMIDVDDAMEQAQDEENRHMVNKLLMLLGNNVTNKRERDARMQRCLQEGSDGAADRDTGGGARRNGSSRRARTEEGSEIDIEKFQEFWAGLPPGDRPALCSVPLKDLAKAVEQLCCSVASSEREAPRDTGNRSHPPASSEAETGSRADSLLQQLHSCLTEPDLSPWTNGGFGLSDALCDIKSMSGQKTNDIIQSSEVLGAEASAPARGLFCITSDQVTLNQAMPLEGTLLPGSIAIESQGADDAQTGSPEAGTLVATEPIGDETVGGGDVALLKRLLAIEASFELDRAGKDQPKMDLGAQITFPQIVTVVRTASTLEPVGDRLPHAKLALGELCRRLLRKEPLRAVLTAQRALLAHLARLMLRGVRTAFGEEQQRLKRREAERAEQELLEALEAEDESKLRDEIKKRGKKKKGKRPGLADGATSELGADATGEDSTSIPGAYVGWDDAAALASEGLVAAERSHAAAVLSPSEALSPADDFPADERLVPASTAGGYWQETGVEDSAARDAREAADVLRVVEAAEAAEAAAAADAADNATKAAELVQTWEEVPNRRRHKKDKLTEATDGDTGDAACQSGPADAEAAMDDAEKEASDTSFGKQDDQSDEDSGVEAASVDSATDESAFADAARDGASRVGGAGGRSASGGEGHTGGASSAASALSKRKGKVATAGTAAPAGSPEEVSTAVAVAAAPGLENKTGQHSCFVNVVVQTLWNVSAFRDAFLVCEPHTEARGEDRSIFLAMKQVCSMMEDGAAVTAVPDVSQSRPQQATASALKEALFQLDSSFELGEMHDATEAHEALLEALHRALAPPPVVAPPEAQLGAGGSSDQDGSIAASQENGGAAAHAPSHPAIDELPSCSADSFVKHIFSMCMRMEYCRPSDPKEEHSKPVTFDQWTQYVVASELRKQVREAESGVVGSPLVRVLRMAAGSEPCLGDGKGQPAPGGNKLQMLRAPRVFTLGLASDTAHASKAEISESLQGIDERLNLRDVYECPVKSGKESAALRAVRAAARLMSSIVSVGAQAQPLGYDGLVGGGGCDLVALTAFYEQHYVCFCFSHTAGQWIHYDDDTRQLIWRLLGKDFDSVKEKCIAGRLHPQLLFYESR